MLIDDCPVVLTVYIIKGLFWETRFPNLIKQTLNL